MKCPAAGWNISTGQSGEKTTFIYPSCPAGSAEYSVQHPVRLAAADELNRVIVTSTVTGEQEVLAFDDKPSSSIPWYYWAISE